MTKQVPIVDPEGTPSDRKEDVEAALFPLPFTPFEFYYLLEDRPGFPSVFQIVLECRGTLDRISLESAYQFALRRHPILAAQIDLDRRRWPSWVTCDVGPIVWVEADLAATRNVVATAATSGVRLRITQSGDHYTFQFVFHHVAVDGVGAFLFIADLFLAYAHYASGASGDPELRRLDVARLRDRDGHQLFNRRVKLVDLVRIAKVHLPLYVRRCAVVCNHGEPTQSKVASDSVADYLVYDLSEEETAALSRVARTQSVMLHELLVRDFFLLLNAWNQGSREGRRPIRMAVPTNLRRREDYRMPAANVFSLAFLTRRPQECEQRESLLASIRDEMEAIKREKRGLYFEAGLRISCAWPAMLRWSLGRKWPFATAVFTNLGTGLDNVPLPVRNGLRVCGDLVFDGGAGAGPLRQDTNLSVAVHTYAGRMSVCVRCEPTLFNPDQQQAILDAYLGQLRSTIELGT